MDEQTQATTEVPDTPPDAPPQLPGRFLCVFGLPLFLVVPWLVVSWRQSLVDIAARLGEPEE